VTPEALATSTGTLLGGTVVVVVVGGCAPPDEWDGGLVVVGLVAADVGGVVEAEGWISLRTNTVAATNKIRTMQARAKGNPPVRRPEPREGCSFFSGGSTTGRQPANLRREKQGFRQPY
jgi:hypothetical protein